VTAMLVVAFDRDGAGVGVRAAGINGVPEGRLEEGRLEVFWRFRDSSGVVQSVTKVQAVSACALLAAPIAITGHLRVRVRRTSKAHPGPAGAALSERRARAAGRPEASCWQNAGTRPRAGSERSEVENEKSAVSSAFL
jgi:hypothetical protein